MAVRNIDDITMNAPLKDNQPTPDAFLQNEEEMTNYSPEINSAKERKKLKEIVLREHPETL